MSGIRSIAGVVAAKRHGLSPLLKYNCGNFEKVTIRHVTGDRQPVTPHGPLQYTNTTYLD